MSRAVAGALAIVVIAACSVLPTGAAAFSHRDRPTATATPTPTPTATATPDPSVPPAAPSLANIRGGYIYWADNSDNEDGFEIYIGTCVGVFRFNAGPNTTFFELSPEARAALHVSFLPDGTFCGYVNYSVTAFNAAGRSQPSEYGIVREPPPVRATPSVGAAPAAGGAPSANGYSSEGLLALSAAGAMLLIVGALAHAMGRMNRDKSDSPRVF
jgi:hypothetical protein